MNAKKSVLFKPLHLNLCGHVQNPALPLTEKGTHPAGKGKSKKICEHPSHQCHPCPSGQAGAFQTHCSKHHSQKILPGLKNLISHVF
ncbi:MAG: hypothetical protein ACLFT4_09635, partial [Bacteroidales bacterium]